MDNSYEGPFLVRIKKKNRVVHLWNGKDTFCTMWSTGGLKKSNYGIINSRGNLPVCVMCCSNFLANGQR